MPGTRVNAGSDAPLSDAEDVAVLESCAINTKNNLFVPPAGTVYDRESDVTAETADIVRGRLSMIEGTAFGEVVVASDASSPSIDDVK